MTTKGFVPFITVIVVSSVLAAFFATELFAAEPPSDRGQVELDCGLGPMSAGLKLCKAVRQMKLFIEHPVGDVNWVIGNMQGAIARAYHDGVQGTVLVTMLLPSLVTKALFADAERHVVAVELSVIVPQSFIEETVQAINRARLAGADVSDLVKRLLKETIHDNPANEVKLPF